MRSRIILVIVFSAHAVLSQSADALGLLATYSDGKTRVRMVVPAPPIRAATRRQGPRPVAFPSSKTGFDLTFSTEETPVKVTSVTLSPDRMRVSLTVDKLMPGRIYELRPGRITAADGAPLITRLAAYTLNKLK